MKEIKTRIEFPKEPAYYKLMGLVWRGIDTEVFKYPKRTGRNNF